MASIDKVFLDLSGLQSYDSLIKEWANSVNQKGYKTILKSADGNSLNLYKKADAVLGTDTPDATVSLGAGDANDKINGLASVINATWDSINKEYTLTGVDSSFTESDKKVVKLLNELKGQINTLNGNDSTAGSVAKAVKDAVDALDTTSDVTIASVASDVVTLKAGIKEVNGVIAQGTGSDIALAKLAKTGNSEDASYSNTTSGLTASNVQAAIDELKGDIDDIETGGELTIEEAVTPTTGYLKTYNFYQGDISDASKKAAAFKGKVDIPKDFLVKSGSVVKDPSGQPAGTYIALVINSKEGSATDETIYINVADLCDAYTAAQNAQEVQLAISNTNEISASVVDIAASKLTYIAADPGSSTPRESVGAALTRLDGSDSTAGSVSKKVKDAIDALDTSTDVPVASYNTSTSTITLANGIKEVNGVISQGTGDGITISPIASSDINALFSTTPPTP